MYRMCFGSEKFCFYCFRFLFHHISGRCFYLGTKRDASTSGGVFKRGQVVFFVRPHILSWFWQRTLFLSWGEAGRFDQWCVHWRYKRCSGLSSLQTRISRFFFIVVHWRYKRGSGVSSLQTRTSRLRGTAHSIAALNPSSQVLSDDGNRKGLEPPGPRRSGGI